MGLRKADSHWYCVNLLRSLTFIIKPFIQGDQNVAVHLMIAVQKTRKIILNSFSHFEDGHHRTHAECGPCYTEHGLREQFGVSINVWRLAGGHFEH
jgi:hypothetical protein